MKPNKVIFGEEVLIDLTEDTVEPTKLLEGETAHDASGETIEGSIPIIEGEEIYNLNSKSEAHSIEYGLHYGNETVQINPEDQEKLIPGNIKTDVTILGVDGTFTSDGTATEYDILEGEIAYVRGERIVGRCSFDIDSRDATATSEDVLINKTAYARGEQITGTIPIYPGESGELVHYISEKDQVVEIEEGFHDGTESVQVSPIDKAHLIPENIRTNISILGVDGSFTSDATATADDILTGTSAYSNGQKIDGMIPIRIPKNGEAEVQEISSKSQIISLLKGYYGAETTVRFNEEAIVNLTPENIREGTEVLGVTGSLFPQADTSDATATADDILYGKTAYVDGAKITGTRRILTTSDEENTYGTTFIIQFEEEA